MEAGAFQWEGAQVGGRWNFIPTSRTTSSACPWPRTELIREHYERGDLVILSDVRIEADFDHIAATEPVEGVQARKKKFIFRENVDGRPETRASSWEMFFGDRLETDPDTCRKFQDEVGRVDAQVDALIRRIFNRHDFGRCFISWKFLEITGENLHIDNLPNPERESTQARLFVNVDNQPRHWSLGRHWRHFAERHYVSAGLAEVAGDRLRVQRQAEPRRVRAQLGDVRRARAPGHVRAGQRSGWSIPRVAAHQIRRGRRLCSAQYEYPYGQCIDRKEALPSMIKALERRNARAGQGGPVSALRALLARLTRRETVARSWPRSS